ncbi:RNA-directed DNA polymerase from mobile element jockey-like, partial [Brachionus plicatilis]
MNLLCLLKMRVLAEKAARINEKQCRCAHSQRLELDECKLTIRRVGEGIEAFLQKYNKLVEKHIPVIHVSKSFRFKKAIPKWSNPQIKKITKEKFKLFSKLRAASKSAAIILRSAYKKKCYEVKKLVAETVLSYEKKIARQCKSNPKLLYSYINDQKKCKDKIRYLVDRKGKQLINEEDIANCLNEAFYNSFNTVT